MSLKQTEAALFVGLSTAALYAFTCFNDEAKRQVFAVALATASWYIIDNLRFTVALQLNNARLAVDNSNQRFTLRYAGIAWQSLVVYACALALTSDLHPLYASSLFAVGGVTCISWTLQSLLSLR